MAPQSLLLAMPSSPTNGDETVSVYKCNLTEENCDTRDYGYHHGHFLRILQLPDRKHQRPTSDCNCVTLALGSNTDNKIS
jgi:hypothetical protein